MEARQFSFRSFTQPLGWCITPASTVFVSSYRFRIVTVSWFSALLLSCGVDQVPRRGFPGPLLHETRFVEEDARNRSRFFQDRSHEPIYRGFSMKLVSWRESARNRSRGEALLAALSLDIVKVIHTSIVSEGE